MTWRANWTRWTRNDASIHAQNGRLSAVVPLRCLDNDPSVHAKADPREDRLWGLGLNHFASQNFSPRFIFSRTLQP